MRALAPFTLAMALATAIPVCAAPPLKGEAVAITAHDLPLRDFLRELFERAGVRAAIDPAVKGVVSGAFDKPAGQIFAQVASAFQLLAYFDGTMLYVQPASRRVTREFSLGARDPARAAPELARQAGADADNRLETHGDRLVASGASRFVQRVAELVVAAPARGDRASAPIPTAAPLAAPSTASSAEYRVYYLRYAWAEDQTVRAGGQSVVVPGLAGVMRRLLGAGGEGSAAGRGTPIPAVTRLGGSGLAAQSSPLPAPLSVAALAAQVLQKPAEGAPSVVQAPRAEPGVRVEADPRLNALIIRDTPARLDAYDALIRALDVEPQLVEIEAKIIDIDIERAKQFGFGLDFVSRSGRTTGSLTPALPAAPSSGAAVSSVIDVGGDLTLRLQALETEGVATITSRPVVLTLSDVEAAFGDSQTFYVRVAGSLNADLFNVTAGTTLRVTPHVLRDGGPTRIRMLVSVQDGAVQDAQVDSIPIVNNAELNTQALINEGQSLLVGGMVVRSSKTTHGKIPLLGDIPFAGVLFRSTASTSSRTERLFLITPHLIASGQAVSAPAEETRAEPLSAPGTSGGRE